MITLRGYQIDIATQLPADMKNTGMRGLLGNYNGIASDDLISRSGRTIHVNSTEERIYHDFGETCKLFIISCDLQVLCCKRKKREAFKHCESALHYEQQVMSNGYLIYSVSQKVPPSKTSNDHSW